jgi:tripartite-type tricarboxylate transporter receptor subunit TctC
MVLQRIHAMVLAGSLGMAAAAVCAQSYPEKSIRLLTPPAGGSTEFTSRLLADAVAGSHSPDPGRDDPHGQGDP